MSGRILGDKWLSGERRVRQMTNDEIRMANQIQMTEWRNEADRIRFVIRAFEHSSFICHSNFVIRHSVSTPDISIANAVPPSDNAQLLPTRRFFPLFPKVVSINLHVRMTARVAVQGQDTSASR